tara:strand:- start:634 stop:2013 length:1380 start_codon:yes stop_codon:yes gene_type:complete
MNIKKFNFENGLKLIYEKVNDSDISSVNVMVKLGSMYEPKKFNGLSHFLEHMVFKGTCEQCRTCKKNIFRKKNCLPDSKSISELFDEVGADFNAYTDKNITSYHVKSNSSFLPTSINVLSDMVLNTNFKIKEFNREKKVVLEELLKGMDDSTTWSLELVDTMVFKNTGLGQIIGGYPKNVNKLSFEDMKILYDSFYLPSNIVISIVSNKSFNSILKMIQKSFFIKNKWRENKYIVPKKFKPKLNLTKQIDYRILYCKKKNKQIYISISFLTCDLYHKDRVILELISDILSGNMSSRFFVNLREKRGLTYSCHTELSNYENAGNFSIITSVDKNKLTSFIENNKNKKGALEVILDTLNEIHKNGFTEKELKKIKGYSKGQLTLSCEDSLNLADYNGRLILLNHKEIVPLKKYYNKFIKNITLRDINRVFKKYFKKNRMSICMIGDKFNKKEIKLIINNFK